MPADICSSGIYALMSFTMAQRTREIGICTAPRALTAIVVGLLATLGPARRGLRIQAIEALRAETSQAVVVMCARAGAR